MKMHRWLIFSALLMMGVLIINLLGLATDHRIITGVPAWLKPAKFAVSTAIYAATLAWLLTKIDVWPRFTKLAGDLTAGALVIEIGIINLQAWRGTTSHFNFTTPVNASLFGIMGIAIAILWLASAGLFAALLRQPFANKSFGWSLRLGMLITVLGSALGGAMLNPKLGHTTIIGAHTVGAPDGGPGLAGTGWSREHGDLRIAHFMGLHGLQAMPIAYWLLARRRRPPVSGVAAVAGSYFALAALLEWQAMRGQSVAEPDTETVVALMVWLAGSALALLLGCRVRPSEGLHPTAHAMPL